MPPESPGPLGLYQTHEPTPLLDHLAGRVGPLLRADSDTRMAMVQQSCPVDSNGPCTVEKRVGGKSIGIWEYLAIEDRAAASKDKR